MSKILYVEDDLDVNKIRGMFHKYLSPKEKQALNTLRMKTNIAIQDVLRDNPCVDVEYSFINAIKKIAEDIQFQYSFFIIDRNLFDKNRYVREDVPLLINKDFITEEEGDYLFFLLFDKYLKHSHPRILLENFYFLTAYPEGIDQIRESLNDFALFFPPDHIIDKSNSAQEAFFVENKINQFEKLAIKSHHLEVFEVFQKGYLPHQLEDVLLNAMKTMNSPLPATIADMEQNLKSLRNILEEAIRKIAENNIINPHIPLDCYDKSGDLSIGEFLDFLNGMKNSRPKEYFSNSLWLLSKFGFWRFSSELVHGGRYKGKKLRYTPSRYSLPILVNILMDFLLWFKDFMDANCSQ